MKKLFLALCLVATSALALVPSPDGTKVGPPSTVIDDKSAIFAIGPDGFVYRNGIKTTGHATSMAWYQGKIWAKSPTSPFNWYTWTNASPPWKNTGSATDPVPSIIPSPNLWTVPAPDGAPNFILDASGATWTLAGVNGDADRQILKDGQQFAGGGAQSLHYIDGKIYAFSDGLWWVADATGWIKVPDPNIARNAANGLSVEFTVIPPAPNLSPSRAGQNI